MVLSVGLNLLPPPSFLSPLVLELGFDALMNMAKANPQSLEDAKTRAAAEEAADAAARARRDADARQAARAAAAAAAGKQGQRQQGQTRDKQTKTKERTKKAKNGKGKKGRRKRGSRSPPRLGVSDSYGEDLFCLFARGCAVATKGVLRPVVLSPLRAHAGAFLRRVVLVLVHGRGVHQGQLQVDDPRHDGLRPVPPP